MEKTFLVKTDDAKTTKERINKYNYIKVRKSFTKWHHKEDKNIEDTCHTYTHQIVSIQNTKITMYHQERQPQMGKCTTYIFIEEIQTAQKYMKKKISQSN